MGWLVSTIFKYINGSLKCRIDLTKLLWNAWWKLSACSKFLYCSFYLSFIMQSHQITSAHAHYDMTIFKPKDLCVHILSHLWDWIPHFWTVGKSVQSLLLQCKFFCEIIIHFFRKLIKFILFPVIELKNISIIREKGAGFITDFGQPIGQLFSSNYVILTQ